MAQDARGGPRVRPAHCEKRPPLVSFTSIHKRSSILLASDGCCRTNKASFHAAGAPAAPALRPLAAVARESSSRVEQVSCGERVSHPVSRATRTGLSSGPSERPPPQEVDHNR